jgi:hypothetical protein
MDFGRAFTYVFEDPDWLKKIGLIALISIIPILGWIILAGYSIEVARRVIRQDFTPLPDLDFAANSADGVKVLGIAFVYSIPIWILLAPVMIVASVFGDQGSGAEGIIAFTSLCCSGLIVIYSFLMAFVVPASYGVLAATGSLGAALRFREVIGLVRASPGSYLIVLLGVIVTGFVAQLGVIACAIGVIFTMAYAMAVNGHLYGQAYLEANSNRGFASVY